jgi:dihydroorotate dehydrogenase (NAD+) catalytic subunit
MHETPSGMLNAIGLQNPGIDQWIANDLAWLREKGVRTIASIAGKSVHDYAEVTRRLHEAGGVAAIEINLSCPNVEHRGLVFACSALDSADVVTAVRAQTDLPLFAKLTSDVTDIVAIAGASLEAGATGLSLINTLLGMAIDPWTGKPRIHNGYGGLSGPAIRPIAIRNVHQVHQAFPEAPIIGMGGVRRVEDVIEFIRAGATAVAIGTAGFAEPFLGRDLIDELRRWLADRGIHKVTELRGLVEPW